MRRGIRFSAKFFICLIVMTVGFTLVWQYAIADRLYNCTDSGDFDFLFPGHWVHRPVPVDRVVAGRSMSEPDTIKRGWSIAGLWGLWGLCVVTGLVVSV